MAPAGGGGNAFEDCLALVHDLGLAEPRPSAVAHAHHDDACDRSGYAARVRAAVLAKQRLSAMQAEALRLQAHAPLAHTTDPLTQQALCQLLATASESDRGIVEHRQTLEARVRSLTSRHSIPVEHEHQAAFARLVEHAFSEQQRLAAAHAELRWLASLSEGPAAWEAKLQPLVELQNAARLYDAAMRELAEELAGAAV